MCKMKHMQRMGEYTLTLSLGNYPIHGKRFPGNSAILTFNFGTVLVCPNTTPDEKDRIKLYVYSVSDQKWYRFQMHNRYTRIMCDFYRRETYNKSHTNYAVMMKHDRKRKTGGSGKRLTPFCGHVTDYECSNNPLHDFRRVYV